MSIDALRAVQSLLPDVEIVESDAPRDESYGGAYSEQPRLAAAECIEGATLQAHRVTGAPEVRFAGFLDGIQRAQMLWRRRGVPIVEGIVAAAVLVRVDRRFVVWGGVRPTVSRKLYMPLTLLRCEGCTHAGAFEIVDTSYADGTGALVSRHPAALHAVAFERVGRDRDRAERELAELWCETKTEPLYVDGGISGSARVASSPCAVGVIKSHQTLYADDEALDVIMSLRRGERSSVFVPPSGTRNAVMSWYLRLRDPGGRDAMFGLVRVEAAPVGRGDIAARANDISRWILAEIAPVSLPDSRWDRMPYGVRACEQLLRAIA